MENRIQFTYNSQAEELIMPEYGRNVQDLVRHCKDVEDERYRQSFAESVVDLMQIMTPYNRNLEEHRKKLWHHFFRIAKYDIRVTPPPGVVPSPDLDTLHPANIEYPTTNDKFRHYGNYIHELIKKAVVMESGPKRDEFSMLIASFMKMASKTWSKDHYTSDDVIKSDLGKMSSGVLTIDSEIIETSAPSNKHQKRPNFNSVNSFNNNPSKMKLNKNLKNKNNRFKKKKMI